MRQIVGVKIEPEELAEMKRLARTSRNATAVMSMARLGVQVERERTKQSKRTGCSRAFPGSPKPLEGGEPGPHSTR